VQDARSTYLYLKISEIVLVQDGLWEEMKFVDEVSEIDGFACWLACVSCVCEMMKRGPPVPSSVACWQVMLFALAGLSYLISPSALTEPLSS
jgi:hypothetical protein